MYARNTKRHNKTHKRRLFIIVAGLCLVLAMAAATWWFWQDRNVEDAEPQTQTQPQTEAEPKPEPDKPKPALVNLQPTLDNWIAAHPGDYGIIVYDPENKKVIAEHQPHEQYFTASIYKMYVVYLALQDLEAGLYQPGEDFQGGRTRLECIKEAIRTSDSPCAEKLALEIGYENINSRLAEYGLADTSFPGFVTSAADAALILQRFQADKDLTSEHKKLLMTALETQVYAQGLPKLAPKGAYAVKTGFQGNEIWHDTGLLTLPNGREYVVAYLSNNAGSSRTAANFGKTIYDKLLAAEN
jgi:beta-lactamase class A